MEAGTSHDDGFGELTWASLSDAGLVVDRVLGIDGDHAGGETHAAKRSWHVRALIKGA